MDSQQRQALLSLIDEGRGEAVEIQNHKASSRVTQSYEGRPNIVAWHRGTGGGRSLLFNGHTDVIPAGPRESWTEDPWSASVRDNRIYGRGACDMKSGVAAAVLALEFINKAGIKLKG